MTDTTTKTKPLTEAEQVEARLREMDRMEAEQKNQSADLREKKAQLARRKIQNVIKQYHIETPPDYVVFGANPKATVTMQDFRDLFMIDA